MPLSRRIAGLVLLLVAARATAQTGTLVAANMTANTISLVDVASGQTVATLPTNDGPHEVAISHDGRWAVVSNYGTRATIGNLLTVIDLAGGAETRKIELGEYRRPHGMKFLPGDNRLLVTSETSQRVLVVDFASGRIDTTIATNQAATHMIALIADGTRAFTTNITPGTVSEVDVRARRVTRLDSVGTRIEGIAVTPDGGEVWVGGNTSATVFVINTRTGSVDHRLTGFGMAYRIGITPDGKTAVISDPGSERIHIYDVREHRARTVIDVPRLAGGDSATNGASPQGVTMAPDNVTAFVTLKAAGKVVMIDLHTDRIVREFTVGGGSDGIGFSPVASSRKP